MGYGCVECGELFRQIPPASLSGFLSNVLSVLARTFVWPLSHRKRRGRGQWWWHLGIGGPKITMIKCNFRKSNAPFLAPIPRVSSAQV